MIRVRSARAATREEMRTGGRSATTRRREHGEAIVDGLLQWREHMDGVQDDVDQRSEDDDEERAGDDGPGRLPVHDRQIMRPGDRRINLED